jgi:hypothetical protein
MISLATELRPPRACGPDAIARLCADAGADGVHVGADGDIEALASSGLVPTVLRAGLALSSVSLPLPDRPLAAARRLPHLSALAADERGAAIALAERGLDVAASFGARAALLDFGPLALSVAPGDFARAFARRTQEDEPGGELLGKAVAERRARAPEWLDACRWSLERLLRAAARRGVELALLLGATPWQGPSPREACVLLDDFGGGPLAIAWDPARLSVLGDLDLSVSDERLTALGGRARVAIENDAVGVDVAYLPLLGERSPRLASFAPPAAVPRILLGRADSTDAEVAAAVAAIRPA